MVLVAHGLALSPQCRLGNCLVGDDIAGECRRSALVDLLARHKTVDLHHVITQAETLARHLTEAGLGVYPKGVGVMSLHGTSRQFAAPHQFR